MTETYRRACFHRTVTYRCGHEGCDSRDNAESIDCPDCAGTTYKSSYQSPYRKVGGVSLDAEENIMGYYSEADRRFAHTCGE